jgi:cytochrome b561
MANELGFSSDGRTDPAPNRFDRVTIAIHWTTMLLIVAMFATAWLRESVSGEAAAPLLAVHRSIGLLLWALTVARLAWRRTAASVPPLPESMARAQKLAARATEYALYGLLILQPLTGFADSVLRGRPFDLLLFTLPALTARHRGLSHAMHGLHENGAWLLLALIGLHTAAALFHRLVLKDRVLASILPWGGRTPAPPEPEILFKAGE